MNKNLVVLSFVAICTLFSAFALAGPGATLRVNVPFNFYAGTQQLPAGEYVFEMGSGPMDRASLVKVSTKNGEGVCMLVTLPGTDNADGRLLFNKYGNSHFLAGVSILGTKAGVPMMKLEKELRAKTERDGQAVTIALR
jgi:hypothetical protein